MGYVPLTCLINAVIMQYTYIYIYMAQYLIVNVYINCGNILFWHEMYGYAYDSICNILPKNIAAIAHQVLPLKMVFAESSMWEFHPNISGSTVQLADKSWYDGLGSGSISTVVQGKNTVPSTILPWSLFFDTGFQQYLKKPGSKLLLRRAQDFGSSGSQWTCDTGHHGSFSWIQPTQPVSWSKMLAILRMTLDPRFPRVISGQRTMTCPRTLNSAVDSLETGNHSTKRKQSSKHYII